MDINYDSYNGTAAGVPGTNYASVTVVDPAATPTLEAVVALADQLDAASRDVRNAWAYFKYGPMPETDSASTATPVPTDRIERVVSQMVENIGRMRDLAAEIRSRA